MYTMLLKSITDLAANAFLYSIMYWCRDGQMVSQVLLLSVLGLKFLIWHIRCYSIAFHGKRRLSKVCVWHQSSTEAGLGLTAQVCALSSLGTASAAAVCCNAAGELQHSRAAGHPGGQGHCSQGLCAGCLGQGLDTASQNSEMHCSECNALAKQAVPQVFVLAFQPQWYSKYPVVVPLRFYLWVQGHREGHLGRLCCWGHE